MAQLEESWGPIATTLGYASEKEMLIDLYTAQGYSLSDLSKLIGFSTFTIKTRLEAAKVKMRGRGGPENRRGKRKLAHLSDFDLSYPILDLAAKYGCHPSTISAERRLRSNMKKAATETNLEVLPQ